MIVQSALIKIGELDIHLTRKDIKNLHISVMPPDGQVRVSAPDAMTETAIRMAVIHRGLDVSRLPLPSKSANRLERW